VPVAVWSGARSTSKAAGTVKSNLSKNIPRPTRTRQGFGMAVKMTTFGGGLPTTDGTEASRFASSRL